MQKINVQNKSIDPCKFLYNFNATNNTLYSYFIRKECVGLSKPIRLNFIY